MTDALASVLTAVCMSGALVWLGWVALDVGRRWVSYRQSTVAEGAELAELRKRIETAETAFKRVVADQVQALHVERERISKLEDRKTQAAVSRSVEQSTAWRR